MDARNPTPWIAAAILACSIMPLTAGAADPSLGRIVTDKELAGWNIDVFPDGTGLPPGNGTVALGEKVYQTQCVACHGAKLEGGLGPALVGGKDSL